MPAVLQMLLNEAARPKRTEALKVSPYERTDERAGYANGFKDKILIGPLKPPGVGFVILRIPNHKGLTFNFTTI